MKDRYDDDKMNDDKSNIKYKTTFEYQTQKYSILYKKGI